MPRIPGEFHDAGLLARRCLAGCALALALAASHAGDLTPPNALDAGLRYFHSGRFDNAAATWESVAAQLQAANDERGRAEVLLRLAQAYQVLGHLGRAQGSLREALASDRLNAAGTITAWTLLGSVLNAAGARGEARKALDAALAGARNLGRDDLASAANHEMGNLLAALDQPREALAAYANAAALAKGPEGRAQRARSLLNAARTSMAVSDVPAAVRGAAAARQDIAQLSLAHERAFLLTSLGELHLRIHERARNPETLARAYEVLQAGLADAERIGDERTSAQALGYLARLYEHEGRIEEAALLNRRAIFSAQQIQAAELLYQLHWQQGRIMRAKGEDEIAVLEYRRAADNLQLVRHDLIAASAAAGTASRAAIAPLYFELADLLLQRTRKIGDPSQTQRLLAEARDVVERSKSAELQDLFQDTCVAEQQARVAQVGSVGAGTAVIYPIILPDRLELLLGFPDGLKQFTVPIGAAKLIDEIRNFRVYLEKRTTRQYLPLAQRLYDLLMRPLEAELAARNVDTIVFVPDGALRTVPMAALHDGKDFLLRRYAIATTPGLTLTDPQPLLARKLDVLLNGLTASVQGFSSLPNVATELGAISKLFGGKVLRDQEYLLASLEREMSARPYNVVHIASHGQFAGDPKRSFLLTYDGKLTMDLLEKIIAPNRYREQPIELLTLSACQTAAGDDRAALGLAGVAVKAGARSALASLWYINDVSSSLLVSDFYRNLQDPTTSKAKALREAQLELLKDTRYRHPGYWAAFLLIGNWL